MFLREQSFRCQSSMNGFHHWPIIRCCRVVLDMSDQMRSLVIAGLRQMKFISSPENITLDAKASINIVGRVDQQSAWGNIPLGSPLDWSFGCVILLYPHMSERLNDTDFSYP